MNCADKIAAKYWIFRYSDGTEHKHKINPISDEEIEEARLLRGPIIDKR